MPPAAGGRAMTLAATERVANTAEMVARFVAIFQGRPVPDLIRNLVTEVDQIAVAGRSYPLTLNTPVAGGTCYICSPVTAYIDYAIDETRNFRARPALRLAVRGLIRACGPVVSASGLDHQVQINNWLFSTNPVPTLGRATVAELRDRLTRDHPARALVLRSLNDRADRASLDALRAEGFCLLPARQIYLFGAEEAALGESANARRDRQAIDRTPYALAGNDSFCGADFDRTAALYDQLYIRKYTPLNPQYTAAYVREMHQAGLMRLRGLRDPADGQLVAVTGLFENGRTLTQPVVGYDTSRPQREGLYRMVMAMAQDHARTQGLFFNMSAGAAAFKRHRQAVPVIEYTAVFADHLPRRQRLAIGTMQRVLTRVGIPLLQRFEL
jgi:hypothetical protein